MGYMTGISCPNCKEFNEKWKYQDRIAERDGKPQCERCGAVKQEDGTWVKTCKKCGTSGVEHLHGLFVPHLCDGCYSSLQKEQQEAGRVCGMCRSPYIDCCC